MPNIYLIRNMWRISGLVHPMSSDHFDERSSNTVSNPAPLPIRKRPWSRPVLKPESVAHRTDKHSKKGPYSVEGNYASNYIGPPS